MSVFEQLRKDEANRKAYLEMRAKEIERLKKGGKPGRKRKQALKKKAKKAEGFLKDPHFKDFEEYITDLSIEANIEMRELGLKNKSGQDIGDEVKRLAVISQVLEQIITEPKELVKILKV